MQPARLLTEVSETRCIVDAAGRVEQIKSALSRGLPVCKMEKPRDGKVAIVASGPSLNDYRKELIEFDGELWAINGAYEFLRSELQRVPDGFVGLDPQADMKRFIGNPSGLTTYYIASCCHSELFDALACVPVKIWHSNSDTLEALPSGSVAVPGGITCVTRAPFLAYMEGYRDITVYGADCGYTHDRFYAFEAEKDRRELATAMTVRIGDEIFHTEQAFLHQASNLGCMVEVFEERLQDAKLTFRCGGLLPAFLASLRPLEDFVHG